MFLIIFGFIPPRSEHHEEIQQIEIPVQYKDLNDGEIKFRREKWPFLDPHSIISFLFGPAKLSVPAEHVREYWQHHARFGETWAERCDDWSRIPLGLFGDSARLTTQYGKVVQLVGIFMNIILWRPSSVRASRFLLFTIAESQLWSYYTLNTVYRRICWSMNTLWEGVHPLTGVYGEALPPKMASKGGQSITPNNDKFAVTEIRGDWSWHKKVFRFRETSWNGIKMCHWCRALSAGQWSDLYWNLGDSSNWVNQPFDFDDWCEERLPHDGI